MQHDGEVGAVVGDPVGGAAGEAVGVSVGEVVGAVGLLEGNSEGASEGDKVVFDCDSARGRSVTAATMRNAAAYPKSFMTIDKLDHKRGRVRRQKKLTLSFSRVAISRNEISLQLPKRYLREVVQKIRRLFSSLSTKILMSRPIVTYIH